MLSLCVQVIILIALQWQCEATTLPPPPTTTTTTTTTTTASTQTTTRQPTTTSTAERKIRPPTTTLQRPLPSKGDHQSPHFPYRKRRAQ